MNSPRRDELVGRLLSGDLTSEQNSELEQFLREDPAFAEEVADLRKVDEDTMDTGRWLRAHPAMTLGSERRAQIRAAAARRERRGWFWLGGLAAAAFLAMVAVFITNRPGAFGEAALVQRGTVVFQQSVAKNPRTRVGVLSPDGAGAVVKACLWIPATEWDALVAADREALAAYLRAQIPAIRRNPEPYVVSSDPNLARSDLKFAVLRDGATRLGDRAYMILATVPQGAPRTVVDSS